MEGIWDIMIVNYWHTVAEIWWDPLETQEELALDSDVVSFHEVHTEGFVTCPSFLLAEPCCLSLYAS